jgi:hypothetical protein
MSFAAEELGLSLRRARGLTSLLAEGLVERRRLR